MWMQVLIFHILVARHTDLLEERDGCLIYDTWYVPKHPGAGSTAQFLPENFGIKALLSRM